MGIFSKKPRIPEPTIIAQLDEACQGVFHPGSQVAGLATAQTFVQRNLRSARIILSGRSITHTTTTESNQTTNTSRTIHYHDDAALLNLDQVVSQQEVMQANVPYTWRFDFRFPDSTAEVLGSSPYIGKRSANKGIYMETGHGLPPTFAYDRGSHYHYAKIQYELQAEFVFEDAWDEQVIVPMGPLVFTPLRPRGDFSQLMEIWEPVQKYSSSRLIGGEKSMMNSLKDKFSRETPSVMVGLKASLPSHFTPGVNFPIYACVDLDNFSHGEISIPNITLRCKAIKLYTITFWRALREGNHHRLHGEHEEQREDTIPLNAVPEMVVAEARRSEYQKGKVSFPVTLEARLPGDVCPGFATFNVVNVCSLKVVLVAEVAGREFELKAEKTVTVLPP